VVEPYGVLDDFRRESVSLVQFLLSHASDTGRLGVNSSVSYRSRCLWLYSDLNNPTLRNGSSINLLKRGTTMAYTIETSLGEKETSLSLLKVLAEHSFDSILVTDGTAQGKIIYANKAFKKLTGHDPADVIGQTPRMLQGAATDKVVIDRLTTALKTGKKFEGKAINYKKDGTPFIMYWRVLPIKNGKNIEAWVAIQREGASI
jgi:PAS domain S-box-containing protein